MNTGSMFGNEQLRNPRAFFKVRRVFKRLSQALAILKNVKQQRAPLFRDCRINNLSLPLRMAGVASIMEQSSLGKSRSRIPRSRFGKRKFSIHPVF